LLLRRQRPHLDRPTIRRRTSRRPFERGIERWQLQQDEAGELLLRVRVGTVLNVLPAVPMAHGRRGFRRVQRVARDVHASVHERLVIRPPGTEILLVLHLLALGEGFLILVDEQGVLHGSFPREVYTIDERRAPEPTSAGEKARPSLSPPAPSSP